jgi:hypothetical protein
VPSRVPYSQRCARCDSARKVEGSAYCLACKRIAERSIAVPGRDVASRTSEERHGTQGDPAAPTEAGTKHRYSEYPEAEQDRDLAELSRCPECSARWGGHYALCERAFDALDYWGEEYLTGTGDSL